MTTPGTFGRTPQLGALQEAVASEWRGMSLGLSTNFAYPDTTGAAPIPFDVIDQDTDGIYNGTDGGVVPAGMAGRWKLSGQVLAQSPGGVSGGLGDMTIVVNGGAGGGRTSYYGMDGTMNYITFPIVPFVWTLAEGDEVQILAGSTGGGGPEAVADNCWLVMEYLGPVPEGS